MDLGEKLKKLAEKAAEQKVDWEASKSEWISNVHNLYNDIEEWLAPWKEKSYIATTRTLVPKSEEPLGVYEIERMEITAGDETIVLEPFGTVIIGGHGRIDIYRRGFKVDAQMLILMEAPEGNLRWELWKDKFSRARLPFNKDTLEQLMDEWL